MQHKISKSQMLFEPVEFLLCVNWPYHSKYDILHLVSKARHWKMGQVQAIEGKPWEGVRGAHDTCVGDK